MGVKSDIWIKRMSRERELIIPFDEAGKRGGVVSSGLSSYGYDARLDGEYMLPRGDGDDIIDPKRVKGSFLEKGAGEDIIIPPRSFILGKTIEKFKIPRDVIGICTGKSTYARCGVLVNVTPLEPEWEGTITISIANVSGKPVKVYPGEGILQVIFIGSDGVCERSYKDKRGIYQNQKDITLSRVSEIGDQGSGVRGRGKA